MCSQPHPPLQGITNLFTTHPSVHTPPTSSHPTHHFRASLTYSQPTHQFTPHLPVQRPTHQFGDPPTSSETHPPEQCQSRSLRMKAAMCRAPICRLWTKTWEGPRVCCRSTSHSCTSQPHSCVPTTQMSGTASCARGRRKSSRDGGRSCIEWRKGRGERGWDRDRLT